MTRRTLGGMAVLLASTAFPAAVVEGWGMKPRAPRPITSASNVLNSPSATAWAKSADGATAS
jgi:hypothetical protein